VPGENDHAAQQGGHEFAISPLSFNIIGTPNRESEPRSHLNMNDLNLLQHFILYTSKKMSFDRDKCLVWERVFPDIAGTNEFLMHLLLALAGLDILTEDPLASQTLRLGTNSTYDPHTKKIESAKLKVVIEHHHLGLKGLQEELWTASESNAEILMIGSMLIVGFAFASLRLGDMSSSAPSPIDPYLNSENAVNDAGKPHTHWLRLVRGASSIMQQHWLTLKRGRCRALLHFRNSHEDWKLCQSELEGLVPVGVGSRISDFALGASQAVFNLRAFLRSIETIEQPIPQNFEQSNIFQEQHHALAVMEDMYMRVLYALQLQRNESQPSSDLDAQAEVEEVAVTSWPTLVSQGFISSLESYDRFGAVEGLSFTILAHLYLTLSILESIWYLGATFDHEIVKINRMVAGLGDGQLAKLMEWPMEVIRLSTVP
jgi:hypothetical protein